MYHESLLRLKTVEQNDNFFMGAVFHSQINYNSLWYCIPKGIKRFMIRNHIHYAPPFIPDEVYE